eukprot:gene1302-2012_t
MLRRIAAVPAAARAQKRHCVAPRGASAAAAAQPAAGGRGRLGAYLRLIRFDKQIGTWLLLIPCWWGHVAGVGKALAVATVPWDVMALYGAGALCMRSAGCILNDMWDKDFDSQVERTKTRPIASGEISYPLATAYLTAHMAAGLGVLLCSHPYAVLVGALSVPLVVVYPACKRFTHLPQLFLGLTFNWGVLVAYASVTGTIAWPVVAPMYAAGVSWTMLYDTVYAHQDKADDIRVGIKSTALLFGDGKAHLYCFGTLTWVLLCVSAQAAALHPLFYPLSAASSAYLLRALHGTDLSSPASCGRFFLVNKWFGLFVLASWTVCLLIDEPDEEDGAQGERPPTTSFPHVHFTRNVTAIRDVAAGRRGLDWDLFQLEDRAQT